MGMVVRTNSMAINANRQLGMNQSNVQKSLEKLSSGFKINRAADDASGLAISEKMKAQIKGLDQAAANSQDGISLIQTAEGATTEIHDMLNRMVELATKSANGTIQNEVDREAIQKEVDDLNSEITRIAKSTNFNGINLLDGSLAGTGATSSVSNLNTELSTVEIEATAGSYAAAAVTAAPTADGDTLSYTVALDNGRSYTVDFTFKDDGTTGKLVDANGNEYSATQGGATVAEIGTALASALKDKMGNDFKVTDDGAGALTFESKTKGTAAPTVTSLSESSNIGGTAAGPAALAVTATAATDAKEAILSSSFTAYDGTNADAATFELNGKKFVIADTAGGVDVSTLDRNITVISGAIGTDDDAIAQQIAKATGMTVDYAADADGNGNAGFQFSAGSSTASSGGLTLQIGDTSADFNKVSVAVDNLTASGIGTEGLDVATQDAAGSAIQTIKDAINKVSTNRANLGSLQNRLEHTINNLNVTSENMTAANSAIRDTDMAKEMMNYTKMNVLTQAAQAMLAQANQQPQAILQLLQ